MFDTLHSRLLAGLQVAPAVLVSVDHHEGSVPREQGAWMAVFASHEIGTVGGGHLEFEAIAYARAALKGQPPLELKDCPTRAGEKAWMARFALGPRLGQCCGGVVWLRFEWMSSPNVAIKNIANTDRECWTNDLFGPKKQPVALFGGGHVGKAIAGLLAQLPFDLTWVDSRDEIFPSPLPGGVQAEHSAPVQAQVPHLAAHSHVLIMSFSHAEDLEVVAECLHRKRTRNDLGFVGLIGSQTKWVTFRRRLAERGFTDAQLEQVTCPIGAAGVVGKEPEVIAVAVAAQLLALRPRGVAVADLHGTATQEASLQAAASLPETAAAQVSAFH